MAKIPEYQSQAAIRKDAPVAKARPAVWGMAWEGLAAGGAALTNAGLEMKEKFDRLDKLYQTTKAETAANQEMYQIMTEAESDKDPWTMGERYDEAFDKAKDRVMEGVNNPEARLAVEAMWERNKAAKMYNINKMAHGRQVDLAEGELFEWIDGQEKAYVKAGNPLEKRQIKDQISARVEAFIDAMVIKPKEGQLLKEKVIKNLNIAEVKADIMADPEIALDNLRNGKYGDLEPGELMSLTRTAETMAKKQEKMATDEIKKMQDQKAIESWQRVWHNDMTLDELETLGTTQQITLAEYKAIGKAITSDKTVNPQFDYAVYTELVEEYLDLDPANVEQLSKFRAKAGNAYADGKLLQRHAEEFCENASTAIFNAENSKRDFQFFKTMMTSVKQWARMHLGAQWEVGWSEMAAKLMQKKPQMKTLDSMKEASQQVIEEKIVEQHPGLMNFQRVPQAIASEGEDVKILNGDSANEEPDFIYRDGKIVPNTKSKKTKTQEKNK